MGRNFALDLFPLQRSCWPVTSSKVEMPFELPFCGYFVVIR